MNILKSPIESPAAWLGVQQQSRTDWIYVLSEGAVGAQSVEGAAARGILAQTRVPESSAGPRGKSSLPS
jgi:hypothetical protein